MINLLKRLIFRYLISRILCIFFLLSMCRDISASFPLLRAATWFFYMTQIMKLSKLRYLCSLFRFKEFYQLFCFQHNTLISIFLNQYFCLRLKNLNTTNTISTNKTNILLFNLKCESFFLNLNNVLSFINCRTN